MAAVEAGLPLGEAERLLRLVRRMRPGEFVRLFRRGLTDAELLRVIGALPAEQRGILAARARRLTLPHAGGTGPAGRRGERPVATAIRSARQQAKLSQRRLGLLVGVRQSSVSQWEWGVNQPSGVHMAALLRVLPSLADLLAPHAPTARGQPPTTRAS